MSNKLSAKEGSPAPGLDEEMRMIPAKLIGLPLLIACLMACGDDAADSSNNGTANNGMPNNGTPNNGTPNNGTPNNGTPNNGTPNNGTPNNGTPNNGTPNNGTPNNGEVGPGDYPNGEYATGILVAPLNAVLPFKMDLVTQDNGDGTGTILTLDLRAVGGDGTASDVLATSSDITIDGEGKFSAAFPGTTLPAEFSPTMSEVVLDVTFEGTVESDTFFCGDVTGVIVTFEIPLDGSAFASIPWADREQGFRGSCEDEMVEIPRLTAEQCPDLTAGVNNGFMSGGADRDFQVILPEDYDAESSYGLAVLFHGRGGTPEDFLEGTPLPALATELGFIFVAPQGLDMGGSAGWDALNSESADIAIFDDIVTCASNTWSVDAERIHAAGHSNGALFTGVLSSSRADVLAAVAPASGGLFLQYSQPDRKVPALVLWGGADDFAFDQDFNVLAEAMIEAFKDNGQYVVACNHNMGHVLEPDFWPWMVRFLADHAGGATPYGDTLPDIYPDYCEIR